MKTKQSSGMALVLVIIALFFMSVVFLVLASNARTLRVEADQQQAESMAGNLLVSAQIWLQVHHSSLPYSEPNVAQDKPWQVTLETASLTSRDAQVLLEAYPADSTPGYWSIHTHYRHGRQRAHRDHVIPFPKNEKP